MAAAGYLDPYGGDEAAPLVERRFYDFLFNFQIESSQDSGADELATLDSQSQVDGEVRSSPAGAKPSQAEPLKEYQEAVHWMQEQELTTLFVDFLHLRSYDETLASTIESEFYRFEPVLRRAITELVRTVAPAYLSSSSSSDGLGEPKEFFVAFFNLDKQQRVRDLRMDRVGGLVSFCGTVTRTSEVRPELLWGRFVCNECGAVSAPVEQQFKYTEPTRCVRSDCGNRTNWRLDCSRSRFVDWQRIRVQENADEIPPGSMPRSVDVVLRHAAVEKAKAGDKAFFVGSLIVIPDLSQLYKAGAVSTAVARSQNAGGGSGRSAGEGVTGMRQLGVRDLTYRVAFLAQSVAKGTPYGIGSGGNTTGASSDGAAAGDENPDAEWVKSLGGDEIAAFEAMKETGTVYHDLVSSLAPMIHGHAEIKKGLLLMLLGGVHKRSIEGVRLRGDINLCIVGDPSTAKSQFLKYATRFWPRSVYTSGKSASAAGLTASIAKDPDTGEFTIEAGALMLADNGICCIDEFDKMDSSDQVAIHEAMEQQTISITKAGIQATLNARTSILAAANPIFGRYDPTRTLRQNINISPPIMSRFDLFFIVLDELRPDADALIADHIVKVHQRKGPTAAFNAAGSLSASSQAQLGGSFGGRRVPYSMEQVQGYVRYARSINPKMTEDAKRVIVNCYRKLRQADNLTAASSSYRVTVRQLESMVRLSEALSRVNLKTVVEPKEVLEAFRLIRGSMRRVDHGDVMLDGAEEEEDDQEDDQDHRGHGGSGAGDGFDGDDDDHHGGNNNGGAAAMAARNRQSPAELERLDGAGSTVRSNATAMDVEQPDETRRSSLALSGGGAGSAVSSSSSSSSSSAAPSGSVDNNNDAGASASAEDKDGEKKSKKKMKHEDYIHLRTSMAYRLREKENEDNEREAEADNSNNNNDDEGEDEAAVREKSLKSALKGSMTIGALLEWFIATHDPSLVPPPASADGDNESAKATRKQKEKEYKERVKLLRRAVLRMIESDRVFFYALGPNGQPSASSSSSSSSAAAGEGQGQGEADGGNSSNNNKAVDARWIKLIESFVIEGYDG